MTKTFCDRCGKEITKEHGWLKHRTLYGTISFIVKKKHEDWSRTDEIYICPECEDSYIRWLENPETDGKTVGG